MSTHNRVVVSLNRAGGESIVLGSGAPQDTIILLNGALGLDVAPVSFDTSPVLAGHGSVLHGTRLGERKIFLPLLLDTNSVNALHTLKAKLLRVVNPMDKRELTLRIEVPGRTKWREIPVKYSGGLEGNYDSSTSDKWEVIGLELFAKDAFWRGQTEYIIDKTEETGKPFLQTADSTEDFFPIVLADSVVDGMLVLEIAGDSPTFPVWHITPPGEDLTLVHVNSGTRFYIEGILNEPITIDMEKGNVKSATYPNNELWDRVSDDSDMFELVPGKNTIEYYFFGATTASSINLSYQPRFLGGHL